MKVATYEKVRELHAKHEARQFGKIAQKLLAIAFSMAGYRQIVEREVQGVDFDAASDTEGDKYAVEVKTTEREAFVFAEKDAEGLGQREKDGYRPVLAGLRLGLLADWIFAEADELEVGSLRPDQLRPYQLRHLQDRVRPKFDQALEEHFSKALTGSPDLNSVLRALGAEVRDD